MLNFTVGPVMSNDIVLEVGSKQVPYFRTPEFSSVMLENERLMKKFAKASEDSRVVFITGSGTASMEASIINFFNDKDKLLIINGGSFGERFCEIASCYNIAYTEIKLERGYDITKEELDKYNNQCYSAHL